MKPQCTTTAECYRELARVMDQFGIDCAITAINSKYVKHGMQNIIRYEIPIFDVPEFWKFAIAEVEGKPVFVGDELYQGRDKFIAEAPYHNKSIRLTSVLGGSAVFGEEDLSWNPPKPKTVIVEMLVEDAKTVLQKTSNVRKALEAAARIENAIINALENLE